MIPIHVETFEQAAARFPAALEQEWNGDGIVAEVKAGINGNRPGRSRVNVFDLEGDTGEIWRLIISVERHAKFGRVLHVSASREPAKQSMSVDAAVTRIMMMLILLSNSDQPFKPASISVSAKGVLHLVFNWPEPANLEGVSNG